MWHRMARFLLFHGFGPIEGHCFTSNKAWGKGMMCRHLQLHLEDLPWPVNVLKFNQVVSDMQPGDEMMATIKDADVVGNLQQLLCSQPELRFDVSRTEVDYCIRVTKDVSDESGQG
jgi:TusA-related sulfurtransferase